MAGDARSLLRAAANERAKAATAGVSDPFASYSSTGSLRCSACDYLGIKHESLWGAHVVSKSHRTNVARIRQEEQLRQAELQRTKDGKRKAEDASPQADERDAASASSANSNHDQGHSAIASKKKARTDTDERTGTSSSAIDPEWELFKSQMESTEPDPDADNDGSAAGAALEAEPQLIAHDLLDTGRSEVEAVEEKSAEELAAEERARKEQEEREEILSRMEEEQRQQDEADQRVLALKQRLQRIKQARLDRQKANKEA